MIEGEVRFGRHDRMLYATDASLYQVEPIGVVCPRNGDEVQKVVEYCAANNLPILPRGGGTSLVGQAVNTAIVIDFSVYMRSVLEIDSAGRRARVQPGVVLDQLNNVLAPHALMFGPDVASSGQATIGGMIGNNSAGARSILYGRTVEHLIGLDVMLADGTRLRLRQGEAMRDQRVRDLTQRIANVVVPREHEIEARFPKIVRHVDGYNLDVIAQQLRESTPGTFDQVNLAHLVCGSEGTLTVTVEAELNLVPRPRRSGLALVSARTVDEALEVLTTILDTKPSAVELIDDVVIGVARQNREYARYVELLPPPPAGSAGAVIYVEYCGDDDLQLADRIAALKAILPRNRILWYTDPQAMNQAWKLRRAGEPLLHLLAGDRKPLTFIEDLAVDPAKLASFVRDFKALVARHGTTAAYYAHASVGCLHIRPFIRLRDPGDQRIMRTIADEATDLVKSYGGALSGEHGDGRARSYLLERYFGREIIEAFRHIKAIFDPHNRLNPGNIVASADLLDSLRVKPAGRSVEPPAVRTFFRYQREHGFGEALELCNGAGVCRRMTGGTMCPSYRSTLDERHSTRGRGNALRLAITGQLSSDGGTPAWNDPETLATLDLCLSCKACKSECPSNVDVSRLKAEYLGQSYLRGAPVPLASRLFGNIRLINQIGSTMPGLANALNRFGPIERLARRVLDLHEKRTIPRFERSLHRWMRGRRTEGRFNSGSGPRSPVVVLFPDCFTTYNETRIGRAAIVTLERLGYRVVLPRIGCCGRALISTGQLLQAQRVCRTTAMDLMRVVADEHAVAVVGCEPSCVSAIKDDWLDLDLNLDIAAIRQLAEQTLLVEEFVESRWNDHPCVEAVEKLAANSSHGPVVLHAHCHQKALWGAESSAAVLRRMLGPRLNVLDSGCCGMAGSFGYTRDHYDLSMKIAEQSLLGQLRDAPVDATILAPGTSCRQQIHDGLGRRALHPIEFVALAFERAIEPSGSSI